jgi:YD repeat-containing protein
LSPFSLFEYDADGEVTETTDADGRQITYSYDKLGRQTGETWLNSSGVVIEQVTFTYDADGEMTGADNPNATETFTYDNGGNLETDAISGPGTDQPTVTLTYSYDPSGDITSVKDSLSGSGATGQGITTSVYDSRYAYCSPCRKCYRSSGPALMLKLRTEFPGFLVTIADSHQKLICWWPVDLGRRAA